MFGLLSKPRSTPAVAGKELLPTALRAAVDWLLKTQLADGGWGGGHAAERSSVEETALAVEALAGLVGQHGGVETEAALAKGVQWLIGRVEAGSWMQPTPIGFYFAKLWYYERLYPLIFTVGALGRAASTWRLLRK